MSTNMSVAIVLGSLFAAVMITVTVTAFVFFRFRAQDRTRLYDLLKHAQEHNQPLSPDLVRRIMIGREPSKGKDVRRGVFLVAASIGLLISSAVILALDWDVRGPNVEDVAFFIISGAVLGLVGGAYLVLAKIQPRED